VTHRRLYEITVPPYCVRVNSVYYGGVEIRRETMDTPWTLEHSISDDPWEADEYKVRNATGGMIFTNRMYNEIPPNKEQAAHIVKCVNAHDKLVEALRVAAMSAGFQYMTAETRALIKDALEGLE
jgi:hypothetical protein